jgi:hypothetical protein
LDLNLTGVLAGLSTPLATAGIGIFVVSTYDTDYLLVRNHDMDRAVRVLRGVGYEISGNAGTTWQAANHEEHEELGQERHEDHEVTKKPS